MNVNSVGRWKLGYQMSHICVLSLILIVTHVRSILIENNLREQATGRLFITGYDRTRPGITREKAGNLPFSLVENDVHESKSFAGV